MAGVIPADGETPAVDVAAEFDPMSAPSFADLYAFFTRARREAPVFYWPGMDMWVLSRHDDIVKVLRDPEHFAQHGDPSLGLTPEVEEILNSAPVPPGTGGFGTDGPDHARIRSSVSRAMAPGRVADIEPRVRELANSLIATFIDDGQVEFVSRFSYPLPITVILMLFGFPATDIERVKFLSEEFTLLMTKLLSPEDQLRCARHTVELQEYAEHLIEQRRTDLGEDLLSDLLRAIDSGVIDMTRAEIIALCQTFIIGGHETTNAMLTNMIYDVLGRRDIWDAIRRDPAVIPHVVEEALRYNPPLIGFFRTVAQPVEIHGNQLQAGARVFWLLASGNHDDSKFSCPEDFRPDRGSEAQHLTFGLGPHYCLGAPLARLEMRVALECLSEQLPGLRLREQEIACIPNPVQRHIPKLLLEW